MKGLHYLYPVRPAFKLYICFFVFLPCNLFGQKIIVTSPDKKLVFKFITKQNKPFFSIQYNNTEIIDPSSISFNFDSYNLGNDISIGEVKHRKGIEDYDLIVGKTKHVHQEYNEGLIELKEKNSAGNKFKLQVRTFDDGIAFRYIFSNHETSSEVSLLDENTTFRFTGDPIVHALLLPNYTTSHEGVYTNISFKKLQEDTLMDMPALFELHGTYVAISEAALLDYPGMYLSKHNGTIITKLSPLPGQVPIKAKLHAEHVSPWRVLLISNRIGTLIESNIITSLNKPCAIKDISWIHPGKTTFPWWNGNVVPDTLNAPGNNFVTQKYYIDFCSRNHIDYHSVVEYGLHQWYMDDGVGFQPGPHSDVTHPVPGLDMKQVCDYARSVGVQIRVWVHWAALYPKIDTAFALFEKWGIAGMMVDYMDRDDQEMVNIQTEILQKAAAHHLHIQFHGAYKPTGLSRTYPNEYTREGTRNYEVDKWDEKGLSPDDDINIPFTRLLAGSTDYHLGGFRAVVQDSFKTQYTRPLVLGTRCHMLAMYVVLENYLQMVCDYPAAYEGQPGFEFIKEIPTSWDETKVLDAMVGEYISIARRNKDEWYVGTITNHKARSLNISFNFLGEGIYKAEIYTDAEDVSKNPNHLKKEIREVTNKDQLQLLIAPGGGQIMRLVKIK